MTAVCADVTPPVVVRWDEPGVVLRDYLAALCDLLDAEAAHHRSGLLLHHVAARIGVLVAALRQEPALLPLPAHPPQRPLAAQLLALEHEARVAVLQGRGHVRLVARVAVAA